MKTSDQPTRKADGTIEEASPLDMNAPDGEDELYSTEPRQEVVSVPNDLSLSLYAPITPSRLVFSDEVCCLLDGLSQTEDFSISTFKQAWAESKLRERVVARTVDDEVVALEDRRLVTERLAAAAAYLRKQETTIVQRCYAGKKEERRMICCDLTLAFASRGFTVVCPASLLHDVPDCCPDCYVFVLLKVC